MYLSPKWKLKAWNFFKLFLFCWLIVLLVQAEIRFRAIYRVLVKQQELIEVHRYIFENVLGVDYLQYYKELWEKEQKKNEKR